jgi:predicted enzyme related to lactoylglutathione lyase
MPADEPPVYRPNAVSYLRIPATDPPRAAAFYRAVFAWEIRGSDAEPAFTDGSGHVIGHIVTGRAPAGIGIGIAPYVYVEDLNAALERVRASGGTVVTDPYREGNLKVATINDPSGNEIGLWQAT